MYQEASFISFVVRAGICYLTIETTPIFANELVQWHIGQIISIYTIMWFVSYAIVSKIGYSRGDAPVLGVMLYAAVYIPLVLLVWLVLWLLTLAGLLPI